MIKRLKALKVRVTRSKDGKTLASNFGYMMLLQVAGYIFPLLTIPYLARIIGVEGFGKIAFAAAVIVWVQTITDWGFNYTATRDVAQNRDNLEKVSEIFSNVLWARIFLMVLSFLLLLVALVTIPYFQDNQAILLLTFLLVPGHIMFPDWFFQAMERMKYITILNLVSKAIFTVMVFVFINDKEDYILQPIFTSLGFLLCGVMSMYIIVIQWQVKIHAPQWREVGRTIKASTDVFINNVMPNLYYGFSTILVGFVGGSVSNGLLDAGRKFGDLASMFMKTISKVCYPYLARKKDQHQMYARLNIIVSIILFLILLLIAPELIKLFFTAEFYPAITVLQISSLSIVFLTLRDVYGLNYLIIRGYERYSRNIIVYTSLFGFLLSFPLVYFYDFIGAALVAVAIHGIQGVWMLATYKKLNYKQVRK